MTQSWWTWQQKKRIPSRLHERCSRIVVVQDFAKPYSRASHARGALLAQPELMTLDQAGRMTAAEIAGNRVVRVTRPGIVERTGLASAGRRIQGGERFSEIGEYQAAGRASSLKCVLGVLRPRAQKLAVGGVAEIEPIVTRTCCGKVRPGHHCLRLEGLHWRG